MSHFGELLLNARQRTGFTRKSWRRKLTLTIATSVGLKGGYIGRHRVMSF